MSRLPATPLAREAILAELEARKAKDIQWRSGRTFGFVYDPGNDALEVGKAAYSAYLTENGLDPTSFPSLLSLENEVVAIVREHLRGGPEVAGTFTSGGTESIFLAVKAARDRARAERPGLAEPEVVAPITAHAAFHKAAHYLGLRVVATAVRPDTFEADVDAVRAAITERTVLVVASAPGYAHGVVDPVREIAALALERGLLCHVDACVGGWLLPYFRRLGASVPDYDFAAPGVTSMSVDLHKLAFCPKGASVVLYRDRALRRHAAYACARWTGYGVVNMGVQSSKSGGPIAAAWATLHALGDRGYLDIARTMLEATRAIAAGVARIPGLAVLGRPAMSMLAIAGTGGVGIFHVIDEMTRRGWYVQPQLSRGPSPANMHLTIGPTNARWIDAFLADLAASVEAARTQPPSALAAQMKEMLAGLDPSMLTDEMIEQMMASVGATDGGGLPAKQAELNEILDAAPPALVERAALAFFSGAFR